MASNIDPAMGVDLDGFDMSGDFNDSLTNFRFPQDTTTRYPSGAEIEETYFAEDASPDTSEGPSPATQPQHLAQSFAQVSSLTPVGFAQGNQLQQPSLSHAQVPNLTPGAFTPVNVNNGGFVQTYFPGNPNFRVGMDSFSGQQSFALGSTTPQYGLPQQFATGQVLQQPYGQNAPGNQHNRNDSLNSNATYGRKPSVPIPRVNSKVQAPVSEPSPGGPPSPKSMTAAATGPMSSNVTIPARPRPGRKPIAPEESVDRRRVQNRMAQRNFRDKRQQKLAETQTQLENLQKARNDEVSEFRRTIQNLKDQNSQLGRELTECRNASAVQTQQLDERDRRISELERAVRELQSNKNNPSGFVGGFRNFNGSIDTPPQLANPAAYPDAGASPPQDGENEIDFTNFGKRDYLTTTTSNDSTAMDYTMDGCGFCTDEGNCACAMEAKHKLKILEPPVTTAAMNVPGSCDACRADPARAKACRDMAVGTRQAPPELTRAPSSGDSGKLSNSSMPPPPPRRHCGTVLDEFRKYGQTPPNIKQLFGREITTYPSSSNGGYEFKETEAAEVLQTLSGQSESSQSAEVRRERRESLTNGMAMGGTRA